MSDSIYGLNNQNTFSYGNYSTGTVAGYPTTSGKITRAEAEKLVEQYYGSGSSSSGSTTTQSLKESTSNFLKQYDLSIKTLGNSSDKVRGQNLDKLLYDKEGAVTDDTVANTVKAVQTMVDDYNSTLKLLNDNVDRGPGVAKQLNQMVRDPAPQKSMEMVGISVNKDGTLSLDNDKLTEALKTENKLQLDLYKDIIGGLHGVADGVHVDVLYGSEMSAQSLVGNDLAEIQSSRGNNSYAELFQSIKGSAYALNNQAVTGMLMNMLV